MRSNARARKQNLKPFLESVFREHHRTDRLSSDPLEFVHRYSQPLEQEVVALVAAQLAYGNVVQIRRAVEEFLVRVNRGRAGSLLVWVQSLRDEPGVRSAEQDLQDFVHRFHRGRDLVLLCRLLQRSWREHGSLGGHFAVGHSDSAVDITVALDRLLLDWRAWSMELDPELARSRSFQHFLSAPAQGSCCKRWCMFLRWMGRKDQLDPGLWTPGSPLVRTFSGGSALQARQLVIPLDTHTGRISRYLGLTERKNLGWKAALEVTAGLREADPLDPVRFDFALARLGILDLCQKRFRVEICRECQLLPVCIFAKSEMKAQAKNPGP